MIDEILLLRDYLNRLDNYTFNVTYSELSESNNEEIIELFT